MGKIIIVGYPKSGNTWLTRLVAEIVQCPVKGFLYGDDDKEIAIEGNLRISEFQCFKSHHQLNEISDDDLRNAKIIYIIRDPRDITLSGMNFFFRPSIINNFKSSNKYIKYLISRLNYYYRIVYGLKSVKKDMIKAVLEGNPSVHYWCRISWKEHLTPYMQNSNVNKINYENLLNNPEAEIIKILNYLGLYRSDEEIKNAIEVQSFEHLKNKHSVSKNHYNLKFLRSGKSEQWKDNISVKENRKFVKALKNEFLFFGYDLY